MYIPSKYTRYTVAKSILCTACKLNSHYKTVYKTKHSVAKIQHFSFLF